MFTRLPNSKLIRLIVQQVKNVISRRSDDQLRRTCNCSKFAIRHHIWDFHNKCRVLRPAKSRKASEVNVLVKDQCVSIFDNDTQLLLTPKFWILPLYPEFLNSARRIRPSPSSERARGGTGLVKVICKENKE